MPDGCDSYEELVTTGPIREISVSPHGDARREMASTLTAASNTGQ